jgi:hypothetical protein
MIFGRYIEAGMGAAAGAGAPAAASPPPERARVAAPIAQT